jgi:hypothetical protein
MWGLFVLIVVAPRGSFWAVLDLMTMKWIIQDGLRLKPFCLGLVLCALGLLSGLAHGQYMIEVGLEKKMFFSQEPMIASVKITNRSGTDVVMGGRGSNWLQFQVMDAQERLFAPAVVETEENFVFRAGETMNRRILLSETHALSEVGHYALKAIVYHPPTQEYYESNRLRFEVTDMKPIWQQSFGVPQGLPDAGRVRNYSLHILRDDSGSTLYLRVTDERSNLRMATFSLGPINQAIDPSFVVDPQNRLQTFHLAVPGVYVHCVIDTAGKVVSREYYKEEKENRPMMATRGGEVFVVGGIPYDPTAPPPTASETGIRRASERPPGL